MVAIVEGEGTEKTIENQEEAEETMAEEEELNCEDQHQHSPYLHQVQHQAHPSDWGIEPTFVKVTGEWTLTLQ